MELSSADVCDGSGVETEVAAFGAGWKPALPGSITALPGCMTALPGCITALPGCITALPGSITVLPGAITALPDPISAVLSFSGPDEGSSVWVGSMSAKVPV